MSFFVGPITFAFEVDDIPGGIKISVSLFETVMKWADRQRSLKIRTNADTPAMAKQAVSFGAEGIGLCRTEHMFFDGDRINFMRQMILAVDEVQRRSALKKLLPFQLTQRHRICLRQMRKEWLDQTIKQL